MRTIYSYTNDSGLQNLTVDIAQHELLSMLQSLAPEGLDVYSWEPAGDDDGIVVYMRRATFQSTERT